MTQLVRPRHVPLRTCIACGTKGAKSQFLRVVRTPQGTLELDTVGKKPGRGAYLCRQPSCWEDGIKRKRLEHALKGPLSANERAMLAAQATALRSAANVE